MQSDILTAPQIATMLGVAPATVTEWCATGKLRAFRAGPRGRWRIHREDLEKFLSYNQEEQEATRFPKARALALMS